MYTAGLETNITDFANNIIHYNWDENVMTKWHPTLHFQVKHSERSEMLQCHTLEVNEVGNLKPPFCGSFEVQSLFGEESG